jgi:hypothetical protein
VPVIKKILFDASRFFFKESEKKYLPLVYGLSLVSIFFGIAGAIQIFNSEDFLFWKNFFCYGGLMLAVLLIFEIFNAAYKVSKHCSAAMAVVSIFAFAISYAVAYLIFWFAGLCFTAAVILFWLFGGST